MSHVTTIKLEIKDLEALKSAVHHLGLQWNEGAATYKWFGRHVGDYPVPEGMSIEQLGKCLHSIGIKGNNESYEVGVIQNPTGQGYSLIYDFFNGGYGLENAVGKDCSKLRQEYAVQVAMRSAMRQGMRVARTLRPDGSVVLKARR